MTRVIRATREWDCLLVLNAQPDRRDLSDVYCPVGKGGGLVGMNVGARSITDFDFLRVGVGRTRRGWPKQAEVPNTQPVAKLRSLFEWMAYVPGSATQHSAVEDRGPRLSAMGVFNRRGN